MAKYLVETYYNCTFKVSHYLDKVNSTELENLEKREDGKFEILDVKLDNRKTKNLDKENLKSNEKNQIQKLAVIAKSVPVQTAINNKNFTSEKYSLGGIYIIRDPRNVITSLKNHYSLSFQDSFEFMTNKNKYLIDDRQNEINYGNFQFISSWTNNYKSWKNYKKFEILFVKYEDLENNTLNTFLKILSFVNKLLKIKSEINEKRVQNILSSIDFDNLKKKESIEGFEESVYNKETGQKKRFFNLGFNNRWEKILPKNMLSKLNANLQNELNELGYNK